MTATSRRSAGTTRRPAWRVAVATARALTRLLQAVVAMVVLGGLCAGLPWALVRFVGWPLPDHLPTLDEVGAVLMAPMTDGFLLDALACLAWLIWLFFAFDVAACLLDVARGARWADLAATTGPLRRVTAILIGSLLLAFLSRTAIAAPAPQGGAATPEGHSRLVATAPARHRPAPTALVAASSGVADAVPGTAVVQPPSHGIHDSLYRIAARCLGDGDRWPEIWALNHGHAQPSGRILTNPNLLHPGDTLRLPQTPPPVAPPPHAPAPPGPPLTPDTVPVVPPARVTPPTPQTGAGAQHAVQNAGAGERVGGVSWGAEVFVSLGLAAAVSAALVAVRRSHHARYQPGSGVRDDDPPVAPVVYQLHLAHLHAQHHDEDAELVADTHRSDTPPPRRDDTDDDPADRAAPARSVTGPSRSVRVLAPPQRRTLGGPKDPDGTAAGRTRTALTPEISLGTTSDEGARRDPDAVGELALDLAGAHGLGFVGPGSYAAARALLLAILTTARSADAPQASVVVPAADLTRLLGVPVDTASLPAAIHIVEDVTAALAYLEPVLLSGAEGALASGQQVLVTTPPAEDAGRARLQGLLDNGGRAGIAALLLGQWRPGVTAYVTAAGTITATDPGLGEDLRGTRAFTLPDTATRDLLTHLRATDEERPTGAPAADTPDRLPQGAASATITGAAGLPGTSGSVLSAGLEITNAASPPPVAAVSAPGAGESVIAPSPHRCGQVPPLAFHAFGLPTLTWQPDPSGQGRRISTGFSARLAELLVVLALHPGGVSRAAVVDALWVDTIPRDPFSAVRTMLSRLRHVVEEGTDGAVTEIVQAETGRYRLDPDLVEVDYWAFARALARRRTSTTDHARQVACEEIVDAYSGTLADGVDAAWLTAAREATRRDALDAVSALARAHVHDDPDYTLDLLETARAFDPHNELVYRDIMRLEHTLGRHEAISRTLSLLETRLAEIDTAPTPATLDLAARLRKHHTTSVPAPPPNPAVDDRPGK